MKAPRHWPLCGDFSGTGEFPAQMATNAENVSIWWRHHLWNKNDNKYTSQLSLMARYVVSFVNLNWMFDLCLTLVLCAVPWHNWLVYNWTQTYHHIGWYPVKQHMPLRIPQFRWNEQSNGIPYSMVKLKFPNFDGINISKEFIGIPWNCSFHRKSEIQSCTDLCWYWIDIMSRCNHSYIRYNFALPFGLPRVVIGVICCRRDFQLYHAEQCRDSHYKKRDTGELANRGSFRLKTSCIRYRRKRKQNYRNKFKRNIN